MRLLLSIVALACFVACGGSTTVSQPDFVPSQFQFLVHIVETESGEVFSQPRVTTLEGTTASIETQFCDNELCETTRIELIPNVDGENIRVAMLLSVSSENGRREWQSDLLVRPGQTLALETPPEVGITYELRTVRFGPGQGVAAGLEHPRDPNPTRMSLSPNTAADDE